MTRGKLLFMFAGLCVVAVLLWIASMLKTTPPVTPAPAPTELPMATSAPTGSGDFYVAGHVHHTGMFSLKSGETIKDAIVEAGNADAAAAELVVRLVRKNGGATSTRSIPLTDVLSGTSDEPVQLGDLIDVVQQAKPATIPVMPAGGVAAPSVGAAPGAAAPAGTP